MNRISKYALWATSFAFALATSFGAANAGAPTHVMPASANHATARYDIRVSAVPEKGKPVIVRMVDKDNGSDVLGGRIAMLRPVYLGIKASPTVQNVPVLLPSDGHGGFVCAGNHHRPGGRLTFRGSLPGEDAVWRDVQVKS